MTALRSKVDESRGKALARRDDAVKVEADRLAKDMFEAGNSKVTEGDGLAAQQSFGPAAQAYQDAESRYAEAGRRSRVVAEARGAADQARVRMAAEKQRARQDAPEFVAAAALERQASQHYQRAAFKEASDSFAAATELFAKAAARPPERPRPVAADEIRAVLDSYVRAFEAKDLGQVQRIRPGLKPDEVKRLSESFDQSKEYRLSLKVDSVDVKGDAAVVKGRREDKLVSKGGQAFQHESTFTFHLKRVGNSWIIDAVN